MHFYHDLTLADIVNVKVLQEIQDKISEATGLAAVVVDSAGQPVTKPSNFTRFCNLVRSTSKGLARVWVLMILEAEWPLGNWGRRYIAVMADLWI